MNLCFSFIEQKVEDRVHISSCCRFSYPLAKKTFPFRSPKVELLQKEKARQASGARRGRQYSQRKHLHAGLHGGATVPGGFASKT